MALSPGMLRWAITRSWADSLPCTNFAGLEHGSESAHDRVIAHLNMPGESAIVREHHRIADCAIVADVTVSEKISAIANARFAIAFGAAIDRAKFAERIFVANFQIGRFAGVF